MLIERDYNTNITFTCGDAVRSIAKDFLTSRNLEHYSYCRIYKNDRNDNFALSTHPEILEDYFRHKFYNVVKYDKSVRSFESSAILWVALAEDDRKLMDHVRQYHRLDNGIVLTKQNEEFIEYSYFAAAPENINANNYYLNNLDELYNFCYLFKEKARKMILDAHDYPLHIADYNLAMDIGPEYVYAENNNVISINDPMFNKLYYTNDLDLSITKREFQCLNAIVSGKKVKMIANELGLAERSVRYYIENLKSKTGMHCYPQLIKFYNQLF